MPLIRHPLIKEFPEFKDQIHDLKMKNNHFSKLMQQYEELDKQVFRIESSAKPTGDEYIRDLKKKRLKLKDDLHSMIKEA